MRVGEIAVTSLDGLLAAVAAAKAAAPARKALPSAPAAAHTAAQPKQAVKASELLHLVGLLPDKVGDPAFVCALLAACGRAHAGMCACGSTRAWINAVAGGACAAAVDALHA